MYTNTHIHTPIHRIAIGKKQNKKVRRQIHYIYFFECWAFNYSHSFWGVTQINYTKNMTKIENRTTAQPIDSCAEICIGT